MRKRKTKGLDIPCLDVSKLQEHDFLRNLLNLNVLDYEDAPTLKTFLTQPIEDIFKHGCDADSCSDTNNEFLSATSLVQHAKLHGEFKCSFCDVTKSYAPHLAIHERECASASHHYSGTMSNKEKGNWEKCCPRCDSMSLVYNSINAYVAHFVSSHLNLELPSTMECPLCHRRFFHVDGNYWGSTRRLIMHILKHHDVSGLPPSQVYTCKICPTPVHFTSCRKLSTHKREKHKQGPSKLYTCDEPECAGLTFPSFRRHVVQHHRTKLVAFFPFKCEIRGCRQRFQSRRNYTDHWQSVHPKEMPHICTKCGRGFKPNIILKFTNSHFMDFNPTTTHSFVCPLGCNKEEGTTLTYGGLWKHYKQCHNLALGDSNFHPSSIVKLQYEGFKEPSENFKCDIEACSEQFRSQMELENHQHHHGNFSVTSATRRSVMLLSLHFMNWSIPVWTGKILKIQPSVPDALRNSWDFMPYKNAFDISYKNI